MNIEQTSENILRILSDGYLKCDLQYVLINHDFILRSEAFVIKGISLWKTTGKAKPG